MFCKRTHQTDRAHREDSVRGRPVQGTDKISHNPSERKSMVGETREVPTRKQHSKRRASSSRAGKVVVGWKGMERGARLLSRGNRGPVATAWEEPGSGPIQGQVGPGSRERRHSRALGGAEFLAARCVPCASESLPATLSPGGTELAAHDLHAQTRLHWRVTSFSC